MNNVGIILLIVLLINVKSCAGKKEYVPYTEHQYSVSLKDNFQVLEIFKESMSKEEREKSQVGRCQLNLTVNLNGLVEKVEFVKIKSFYLTKESKKVIEERILSEVRFVVEEEAQEYYNLINKPIVNNITVIGKELQ